MHPIWSFCSLFSFEYKTSSKTISHKRNKLFLPLTKNGDFTICSYYHKFHNSSSVFFPWKGIWKVKAPRHVSFFVWTATWDRILTGDNLRLRGFDFVDWCIMCCCCGEKVDHLLLHCEKAYRLWYFIFRIFGISWVPSRTVSDFLFSWWNWLGKHSSYIWNLVPLCLIWCIWRERNQRAYEDLDRSEDQLLALFSGSLFYWAGLRDSRLVTLFLYSLALFFFVINAFLCLFFSIFFVLLIC